MHARRVFALDPGIRFSASMQLQSVFADVPVCLLAAGIHVSANAKGLDSFRLMAKRNSSSGSLNHATISQSREQEALCERIVLIQGASYCYHNLSDPRLCRNAGFQ